MVSVLQNVKHYVDILRLKCYICPMKTISIRELKAHWSEVERQVALGETFTVLNRGRPAAMITLPGTRRVLKWDDHLETAVPVGGRTAEDVVRTDREGRW
jgi:antitoxin (DNA-binding transcriptional repressor) of toxin-antitoxin stability system